MIRVQALYANRRWATWLLYSTFTLTHLLTAGFGAHSVVETYREDPEFVTIDADADILGSYGGISLVSASMP